MPSLIKTDRPLSPVQVVSEVTLPADLTQPDAVLPPEPLKSSKAEFVVLHSGLGGFGKDDEITRADLGKGVDIDRLIGLGAIGPYVPPLTAAIGE